MSYSSFSAIGYRGLGHIELSGLARINLVAGRNDVGKTSLLEAIYLHACGPFAGGNALGPALMRNVTVDASPQNMQRSSPWSSLFFRLQTSQAITFDGTFDGRRSTVSLSGTEASNGTGTGDPQLQGQALRGGGAALSISYSVQGGESSEHVLRLQALPGVVGGAPTFTFLDPQADPSTIIPGLMVTSVANSLELAQMYSTLRERTERFDLVGALRTIDERILGLEVLASSGQPSLHVDLDGVGLIPVSLLGGGPVALATFVLSIVQTAGGIVLIDEIENGHHWTMLKHVWSTVAEAAEKYDVQVFATTHSRECLLAAAEALEDDPESLMLYRLHRRGAEGVEVAAYDRDKLDTGLDLNVDLR